MAAIDDSKLPGGNPLLTNINGSFTKSETIDKSTTHSLEYVTKKVWVGSAGNLKVKLLEDNDYQTLGNVPAGTLLDIRITDIHSDTTCDNIVGLR